MIRCIVRTWAPLGAGLAALLVLASASRAADWTTLKGRVVWADGVVPKPVKLKVDKDKPDCKNGDLYSEELVIDSKTKGVRYVVVWLTSADDAKKPLMPIHPALTKAPAKTLTIDQPCCMFEPRLVAIRGGQNVLFKNSAKISHNVDVRGGDAGPNINKSLPPGGAIEIKNVKARSLARPLPIQIACGIHGWMKGWVAVFPTPYFAVTKADGSFEIPNVPVGRCRLIVWQESAGWVLDGKSPMRKGGKVITVGPGAVTDIGIIDLKLPKED